MLVTYGEKYTYGEMHHPTTTCTYYRYWSVEWPLYGTVLHIPYNISVTFLVTSCFLYYVILIQSGTNVQVTAKVITFNCKNTPRDLEP